MPTPPCGWEAEDTNNGGRELEEIFFELELTVLNQGNEYTFDTGNRKSITDVNSCKQVLPIEEWNLDDWKVENNEAFSDHKHIAFSGGTFEPRKAELRNLNKANCNFSGNHWTWWNGQWLKMALVWMNWLINLKKPVEGSLYTRICDIHLSVPCTRLANVSVGYPTMHKAIVFLYVYNSTLCSGERFHSWNEWMYPNMLHDLTCFISDKISA